LNGKLAIGVGVLLFFGFLGVTTYMMLSQRRFKVEVCMGFQGRTNCSVASGASEEEATRTATSAACTLIASGVTDSQACERSQPMSVRAIE
jgi:hypothetical protein